MFNEQSEQHENNAVDVVAVEKTDIETTQHENNVDVVVDVEKINNTKCIPPTEVSVSYSVFKKFNDMLEQLIPNYDERIEKRQQIIDQVFLSGINNISNTIQQQQQQHCFFVENGKTPRPQVLENYAKLAYVLESGTKFPQYGEKFLRNTVKRTLNVTDDRTEKKYLVGILNYSTKLPYTSGYNVTGFCESFSDSFKCKAGQNLDDFIEL